MFSQIHSAVASARKRVDRDGRTRLTTALTLAQLVTAGTAFIANLLSSAALDPSERGWLALLLQITYLLAVAITIGVESPLLAHTQTQYSSALGNYTRAIAPGVLVLVPVAGLAIATSFSGRMDISLICLAVAAYALLNALGKGVRVASISAGRPRPIVGFTISTQVIIIVGAILLSEFEVEASSAWFLLYCASGIVVLITVIHSRAVAPENERLSVAATSRIRSQGLHLLPAAFGNTVMLRSDRFLLPILAGVSQLGVYVAIATVMELVTWPVKQWVDTSLRIWRAKEEQITRKYLLGLNLKVLVSSSIMSSILGVTAAVLVVYWLPIEYRDSLTLIPPLGLASIAYSVRRVQTGLLIALGRPSTVSVTEIIGFVLSVGAYLALIPHFGALGAALGSLFGYVAALAVSLRAVSRVTSVTRR